MQLECVQLDAKRTRFEGTANIPLVFQMEDECSIGNDETRIFILSSFASKKMNRVPCVTCSNVMVIYDR